MREDFGVGHVEAGVKAEASKDGASASAHAEVSVRVHDAVKDVPNDVENLARVLPSSTPLTYIE